VQRYQPRTSVNSIISLPMYHEPGVGGRGLAGLSPFCWKRDFLKDRHVKFSFHLFW